MLRHALLEPAASKVASGRRHLTNIAGERNHFMERRLTALTILSQSLRPRVKKTAAKYLS